MKTMINYDNNTIGYSGLIRTKDQILLDFNLDDIEGTIFYALGVTEPNAEDLRHLYIPKADF
jgi:hypothetical protein